MTDFTITRDYQPNVTLGVWSDENGEICKNLEPPWKNNLADQSCIPEGTYRYTKYFSPHLQRDVLLLNNDDTAPRADIEAHNGSTVLDTHGCSIVGDGFTTFTINGAQYTGVTNSKLTLYKLVKLAGDSGTITFTS